MHTTDIDCTTEVRLSDALSLNEGDPLLTTRPRDIVRFVGLFASEDKPQVQTKYSQPTVMQHDSSPSPEIGLSTVPSVQDSTVPYRALARGTQPACAITVYYMRYTMALSQCHGGIT